MVLPFVALAELDAPALALAQSSSCSAQGYTVVFVNGVFDTKAQADADKFALQKSFGPQYDGQPVSFYLGYNPTHLAGAGDVLESVAQQLNTSITDFDLDTILMQIYPEVTTRKLLIVGHSQGADYSNEMYSYLLAHGEPSSAVGVYAVATPMNYVAGGGKYVNSTTDKVINMVSASAEVALEDGGKQVIQPLPPNVTLVLTPAEEAYVFGGHSFTGDYLAQIPGRITSDISGELAALVPIDASPTGDCFTPPDPNLGYQTQQALFAVADPTATVLKGGVVATAQASAFAFNTATTLVADAVNAVVGLQDAQKNAVANTSDTLTSATTTEKTDVIINKLYGSSLEGLSAQDKKDLLGGSQGSAVALALAPTPKPATTSPSIFPSSSNGPTVGGGGGANPQPTIVAGDDDTTVVDTDNTDANSTIADDTTDNTEASSTPPVLFNTSTTAPILSIQECAHSLSDSFCLIPTTTTTLSWLPVAGAIGYTVTVNCTDVLSTANTSTTITLADQASSTLAVIALDASSTPLASATVPVYVSTMPVVINEIEWAGDKVDPAREWFELKNRTPYVISLSNVALYAEDGGSQYIPLAGAISAHDSQDERFSGFFIVERVDGAPAGASPKVEVNSFDQLADSGEQIALAWQSGAGTTTLDETPAIATCNGWCAGSTVEQSGVVGATLSMERISADASGLLQSNWASNDTYSNVANMPGGYGEPLYATLGEENSTHLPEVGWLCNAAPISSPFDSTGRLIVPDDGDQVVHSSMPGATCSYLARFIAWPGIVVGALFKGDVGSSTLVSEYTPGGAIGDGSAVEYGAGDHLDNAQNGDHYFVAIWQERINMYPFTDDNAAFVLHFTTGTDAPHDVYRTIPFTFEQ